MNYRKVYDQLITSRKQLNRSKVKGGTYYERHHIIPTACGGLDHEDNLVLLTAKEHFVAHMLLIHCYDGVYKSKMASALWYMCKGYKHSQRSFSSSQYKYAREQYNKNHPNKGKPSPMKGRKCTAEHIEKVRLGNLGKFVSPETRLLQSKIKKGKRLSKLKLLHRFICTARAALARRVEKYKALGLLGTQVI